MNNIEIQKIIEDKKLKLKQHVWYRALEILYSVLYIGSILIILFLAYSLNSLNVLFWGGIIFLAVFFCIKRAADYILIGPVDIKD